MMGDFKMSTLASGVVDQENLSLTIEFSSVEKKQEFEHFLQNEFRNNEAYFTSQIKFDKNKIIIQAKNKSDDPDWENKFYLACIQQTNKIQMEHKAQDEKIERKRLAMDKKAQEEKANREKLTTEKNIPRKLIFGSGPQYKPLSKVAPDLQPLNATDTKFTINTGNSSDPKSVQNSVQLMNSMIGLGIKPGFESNFDVRGNEAFVNFMIADLIGQLERISIKLGDKQLQKSIQSLSTTVSKQNPTIKTHLSEANSVAKRYEDEARAEAKKIIEQEKTQQAKNYQAALGSVGIKVSEETAGNVEKASGVLDTGFRFLNNCAQFGIMGAILGGASIAAESFSERVGPSREDQLTAQIMHRKMIELPTYNMASFGLKPEADEVTKKTGPSKPDA